MAGLTVNQLRHPGNLGLLLKFKQVCRVIACLCRAAVAGCVTGCNDQVPVDNQVQYRREQNEYIRSRLIFSVYAEWCLLLPRQGIACPNYRSLRMHVPHAFVLTRRHGPHTMQRDALQRLHHLVRDLQPVDGNGDRHNLFNCTPVQITVPPSLDAPHPRGGGGGRERNAHACDTTA